MSFRTRVLVALIGTAREKRRRPIYLVSAKHSRLMPAFARLSGLSR